MTEPTQVLLIVVITVLTIVLTVIGVQFFFILKELKKSLEKVNKLLDDGTVVSGTIAKSVTGVSGVLSGIKAGLSLFKVFKSNDEEEDGEE